MAEKSLAELLEEIKDEVMDEEQKEAHRRSFVYGNCKLANEHVTEEIVKEVAESLKS